MAVEVPGDQEVYVGRQKYNGVPPRCHLLTYDVGQLSLLLWYSAHKAGLTYGAVGASLDSPAGRVADVFYTGNVKDGRYFQAPLEYSDFSVIDNEHVHAQTFIDYSGPNRLLFPPKALPLTQNKLVQQQFLRDASAPSLPGGKLPIGEFNDEISSLESLMAAASKYDFQCMLQTGTEAYDGRGNALIKGPEDVPIAWQKLGTRGNLFLEKLVNFKRELAVQVIRGFDGQELVFPLIESDHVDGQLYLARSSYHYDARTWLDSTAVAKAVSQAIPGVGLLTVELFQLRDQDLTPDQLSVLINEICIGRPHNSGHHGIDSLVNSQFDQIVRLAQNLPLGGVNFKPGISRSAMLNLLGTGPGGNVIEGIDEVEAKLGVKVYPYFKDGRLGRKLGHINSWGRDEQEILERLHHALELLNQNNRNLFQYHPQVFSSS